LVCGERADGRSSAVGILSAGGTNNTNYTNHTDNPNYSYYSN
jgi:hypothetical protein